MNSMWKFEIRKIIVKPMNRLVLIGLCAIILLGSFLSIRDVKYIREDGTTVSGISAAKQLKKERAKWEGTLTEDVLKRVVAENHKIAAESANEDEAFRKKQPAEDINMMLNTAFAGFDDFDYYKADHLSEEEAAGLYQKRIDSLKEYLSREDIKDTYSENEKAFLVKQWENLKTPFHYEYVEGWKALVDSQYMPTLMTILVVALGALISGIFSDEFAWKADSVFFSTKLGRNKAVASKISAGILLTTVVYWAVIFLFSAIVLVILGAGGADCPVQIGKSWKSIYNLTYGQAYLLTVIGGYVGSMFMILLAMLISAKTRSTAIAITVPFILSCVPMFLGRIPFLSRITSFFPDMLLKMNQYLDQFLLVKAGGKVMGAFTAIVPLYLLLAIIIIPVLYLVYKKAEVK